MSTSLNKTFVLVLLGGVLLAGLVYAGNNGNGNGDGNGGNSIYNPANPSVPNGNGKGTHNPHVAPTGAD
jgi:hypothetical protein